MKPFFYFLSLLLVSLSHAFVSDHCRNIPLQLSPLSSSSSSHGSLKEHYSSSGVSVSIDDEYPQNFSGRLWFNPALVKVPKDGPGSDVNVLSLFGYSLGGTVTLEYDSKSISFLFVLSNWSRSMWCK